jgi:hypothetical protein
MAEIADRGLVGHRLAPEINADETPHRMGVVERFLSSRIGQVEPLLERK